MDHQYWFVTRGSGPSNRAMVLTSAEINDAVIPINIRNYEQASSVIFDPHYDLNSLQILD